MSSYLESERCPSQGGQAMIEQASYPGTKELEGQRWAPRWWGVLLIGLALWGGTVLTAFGTGNILLLPSIVLLGSFLVPITAVVRYLDHDPSPALSPRRILTAFLIGGVMGVLGASLLEYWLVRAG